MVACEKYAVTIAYPWKEYVCFDVKEFWNPGYKGIFWEEICKGS